MRKHFCPACNALNHGIKSRRAFEHIGCKFDKSSKDELESRDIKNNNDFIKEKM